MMRRYVFFLVFLLLSWPLLLAAQEPAPADPADAEADRMEAIEEMLKAQQQQIDALEQRDAEQSKKNEALEAELEQSKAAIDEMAMDNLNLEGDQVDGRKPLAVFGFFDLTFGMRWFEHDDSIYYIQQHPNTSFYMSNINLYFKSEMTDTLSVLIETRFSFNPHGDQKGFETVTYINGSLADETGEYVRVDTTTSDPATSAKFRQGGVTIERAHLDYDPFDWLHVRAGRFLTPYGVWNVDHGSPVLVAVTIPTLVARQVVPMHQTGIYLSGRVFPSDEWQFDYGVTLSNGRGPTDEAYDLNQNKGVGVKAKFSWTGQNAEVSFGGYGYWGKYTDSLRQVVIQLDPDLTLDQSQEVPIGTNVITTDEYEEWILSTELSIELYGVRLIGEYAFDRVEYEVSPELLHSTLDVLSSGGAADETGYMASHYKHAFYVLLAYELPLSKWIGQVKIMPYGLLDFTAENNTQPHLILWIPRFGINVKVSPFVVLKAEAVKVIPKEKTMFDEMWSLVGQMAVSF